MWHELVAAIWGISVGFIPLMSCALNGKGYHLWVLRVNATFQEHPETGLACSVYTVRKKVSNKLVFCTSSSFKHFLLLLLNTLSLCGVLFGDFLKGEQWNNWASCLSSKCGRPGRVSLKWLGFIKTEERQAVTLTDKLWCDFYNGINSIMELLFDELIFTPIEIVYLWKLYTGKDGAPRWCCSWESNLLVSVHKPPF